MIISVFIHYIDIYRVKCLTVSGNVYLRVVFIDHEPGTYNY